MSEMISKWEVVNKLTALENEFQQYKPFHGFEHAMYRKICELEILIGKTPGVEIVRCKDCKHFYSLPNDHYGRCEYFGWYGADPVVNINDYCSHGERRTDNES